MNKDRSLLFGMLAVSMKKVRSDKMSEVARKTENGSDFDLGNSLVEAGLLSMEDKHQIDSLVELSLAEHEGDAARTIQEIGKNPDKLASLVDSMDDFVDQFEKNRSLPDFGTEGAVADSILGDVGEPDSLDGNGPAELDSLVEDDDPAKTRVTQGGSTGDKASIGNIALGDAPDSFFQSLGNTNTQIMSPVQAAAEIDESEIVPAVAEHEGRYDTIREFAKGGMGQITLVHDTHLGRDIALKQLLQRNILPETRPGAPTTAILTIPIIARFLQEARITGQLEHPSIIPVYELGYRKDGSLYYTMKLIRGQSMHEFLKDAKDIRGRLTLLPHFLDLCFAITYAHSRGVIHRDLKPMNIMIGEFGETVVIDWGIAKVQGQDDIHAKGLQETVQAMRVSSAEATAKTMYGQTIGSPYFMPAEQAMGRTDLIDERSDIYSLGAVLYVILTGQMPYAGNNVREFMGKVGQVEPKPVGVVEPKAPAELAAIVKKAMALVPENRYQSAKELTDEIQKYLSGGLISAYEYSFVELAKRFYKKHRTKILGSAAAALALIVFGVIYSVNVTFQKNRAEDAEAVALEERDRAQQQLYYANIANARFNINEQQMASARALLASCEPAELREWEWGHLEAETHADLMTLDRGGRFTAFTADGEGLLTGTTGGTVSLYDLATGEILHEFVKGSGNGYVVAASDDVSRLALRGDAAVYVWDVATREALLHFDEPQETDGRHFMAFSGNGKYVAALNGDRTLRVWDVDTGEVVLALENDQPQGFSVSLSTDGSRMLVARQVFGETGWQRGFELYAVPGGEQLGIHPFPEDSVLTVKAATFSPDNRLLALATDNNLMIWDAVAFTEKAAIPELRFYNPDIVSFSPDGAYVAAGNNDGGVTLYHVASGNVDEVPKGHEAAIRGVRFTHGGTRVATIGDDRTIRLWSAPGLRPLHTYRGHDSSVFTVAFNQDDTRMASSSSDGLAKVWDTSADLEFAPSEFASFTAVVYEPVANQVAGSTERTVLVWDARSGHRSHELAAHDEASKALAFNADGTLLVSVGLEGGEEFLRVWNLGTEDLLHHFPTGLPNSAEAHFIASDTEVLLKSGTEVARFDLAAKSGTPVFGDLPELAGKQIFAMDVSDDGNRLAASFQPAAGTKSDDPKRSHYAAVYVPLDGGGAPAAIEIENLRGLAVFLSPVADKVLLCQVDPTEIGGIRGASIYYWSTAENSRTTPVSLHKNSVNTARFSRDGAQLATGDRDGTVVLWDAATLEERAQLRGHAGGIVQMDFSGNGKRLVTGSQDKTFKIWDVTNGQQVLTVNNTAVAANLQVAEPTQVAFSEQGLHLATITDPPVSPLVLHAFSTDMDDYPPAGNAAVAETPAGAEIGESGPTTAAAGIDFEQFKERVEAYKRQYWRQP